MKPSDLPPIQGRRFDIETVQDNALSLARQADKGPTWLRHGGRVAYVVMTEEVFDDLWPDTRRAWAVDEMPDRMAELLLEALEKTISDDTKD